LVDAFSCWREVAELQDLKQQMAAMSTTLQKLQGKDALVAQR
jgi:hypothetical protein